MVYFEIKKLVVKRQVWFKKVSFLTCLVFR